MKLLKKLAAAFAGATALAFSSCSNLGLDNNSFQNKVSSYFVEMTSSAAVALYEIAPNDTVKNKAGVDCVPASGEHVVSFYLRNPQKYRFGEGNMMLQIGDMGLEYPSSLVTIAQDPDDSAKINITYDQSFLLGYPLGTDISPKVELFHPVSHKSFGVFDKMKISSDSPPPSVQLACFQRDGATENDHYVVCFYLPDVTKFANSYSSEGKTDVHTFYINGTKKYLNVADKKIYNSATVDDEGNWTFTDEDTSISGTKPSGLQALSDEPNAFAFTGTEADYQSAYVAKYMTLPETIGYYGDNEVTYSLALEDDAGLSAGMATSNKASRLSAPILQDTSGDPISDGTVVTADEESGFYTLRIVHNGMDEGDGTNPPKPCGQVNINYTITKTAGSVPFGDEHGVLRGSSAGSATIKLPGRCTFDIQATASKNYYITSLKTEATTVRVTQPAVFYVSQSGEDEGGTGARATPFRTVQKALDTFKENASSLTPTPDGKYPLGDGCKVYVMSDITVPDSYHWPSDGGKPSFVVIDFNAPVTIQGYGGTWTLDASILGGLPRSCITISDGNLTLQNINITGAQGEYRNGTDYAGIYVAGGGSDNPRLDYQNGRVYGNKLASAVLVTTAGTEAKLTNVKIENNGVNADDCAQYGAALHVGGNSSTKAILTNCDILNNGSLDTPSTGGAGQGGAVYVNEGRLEMTGGSIKGTKMPASDAGTTQGGAVYVYDGYADLTNVEISGTSGAKHGGAIYCDSGTLTLKSCTIKDNSADKYGAIYCDGALILNSTTITGNHAADRAGVHAKYGMQIKGKNIIYDNCLTGTTTQSNFEMPYGQIINVDYGEPPISITESVIGIYVDLVTGHHEPTVGHPEEFTSGYGYTEGQTYPPKPGIIFKSENGFGIAPSATGNAAFAVSSASSYSATDYTFTPTLRTDCAASVYPGATKTFVINDLIGNRKEPSGTPSTSNIYFKPSELTLYTRSGTPETNVPDPTGKAIKITAALYSGGTKVRDATVDPTDASKITLVAKTAGDAATLPPGNYTLKVFVEFLGIKHEANIPIAVDYSAETVADYISGLSASPTNPVIVKGTVGPGMDYSTDQITSADDGLAKVAKAIKNAASDVMISLDARETNYVPADGDPDADDYNPLANYNNNSYFAGCAKLKEMYLPDWLQYIVARQDGSDAIGLFEGCSGLTKVELSSNVKLVMYNAFKGCSSLARISLSEKISGASSLDDPRGIQAGAFVGCAEGFKIDFAGTKEQWKSVVRPNQTTTTAWHDGAKDTREDDGSVTCTDGKCGFDYKDVTALSIPLTLEAVESSVTVTFDNKASGYVFYKINDGDEQNISANQSKNITLDAGDKVEFFGNNETYTSSDGYSSYSSKISCDADCYVYGNVMSLVDKDNFETNVTLTGEYTFNSLFINNTHIKNHPSKDLLLPATTLQTACYRMMFQGCTNLERAPNLPAERLQYASYEYMFNGCQKLVTPPVISATTVARQCCEEMFKGCTSLTTAPALPATTLGASCYKMMFAGCTSLTTAPELPASTLESYCYKQMFQGCTRLNSVTCHATSISAEECTKDWLYGVASDGTFSYKGGTSWESGSSGIPSGWMTFDDL